ncbi:MAG: EF-hand domain-containing protein [Phyllobacterium sp.]
MRTIILTAACSLLLATGVAGAQQAPAMHQGHLDQLDTNKSGGVSKAEYQAFMNAAFTQIDANGDGFISQGEVTKTLTANQFTTLDANKDGRVSKKEFMSQVMKDFAAADRGGDGQLK